MNKFAPIKNKSWKRVRDYPLIQSKEEHDKVNNNE